MRPSSCVGGFDRERLVTVAYYALAKVRYAPVGFELLPLRLSLAARRTARVVPALP
jgi:hypothetical protein